MANITLRVNGRARMVDVEPATPLLYVLRNDLELQGPRFGCGLGQCGACTVLVKGAAVRSCVTPVSSVQGADITTLEGLAANGTLHPLQQAWIDEQVPACGYCQNGQILTAKALLDRTPNPTDAQIRQGMANTLCRCLTYYRIQAAIKRAAATMRAAADPVGGDPRTGPGDGGRDPQSGPGGVGRDPRPVHRSAEREGGSGPGIEEVTA
jgi:aerobic-type carbon monoxide dehydrogenase small subunit (CoxS/CutS family)